MFGWVVGGVALFLMIVKHIVVVFYIKWLQ